MIRKVKSAEINVQKQRNLPLLSAPANEENLIKVMTSAEDLITWLNEKEVDQSNQRYIDLKLKPCTDEELVQTISLLTVMGIAERIIIFELIDNHLASLPETFEQLTQLRILYLTTNQLTTLPATFGNLTQLERLYLPENQLRKLPHNFGNLTQLVTLHLNDNRLAALPDSFRYLTQLKALNIGNNQLATLPEYFGNLTQLRVLWLENNQLTTLPDNFGNLTRMELLILNDNHFITLPTTLPTSIIVWPSSITRRLLYYFIRLRSTMKKEMRDFLKLMRILTSPLQADAVNAEKSLHYQLLHMNPSYRNYTILPIILQACYPNLFANPEASPTLIISFFQHFLALGEIETYQAHRIRDYTEQDTLEDRLHLMFFPPASQSSNTSTPAQNQFPKLHAISCKGK